MQLLGVDTSSLKPQFDSAVPNRVLLLDGDGLCYRVTSKAKTMDTAIRQYVKQVMEYMFLANCTTVRIHLTAKRSVKAYRSFYPTVLPYQGNRKGKPKPPLLEALRNAIAHHHSLEDGRIPLDWSVFLHDYWEADDGLVQDSLYYGDNGVIWSEDKDLRLSRGPYFELDIGRVNYIDDAYGWVAEAFTEGGSLKVKGHGTKFFWTQMLMGDSADHVKGIQRLNGKLCGEAGALEFILPIQDENEAANKVLWAYAKGQQQFLPEAEVLWLRRHPEDSAYQYIRSLDLDGNLRKWLEDSHAAHEKILAAKFEELRYAGEDC